MNLSTIADEIFSELDEPSDTTPTAITFWLGSNMGRLNILIEESFEVDTGVVTPDLDNLQQSILKQLYLVKYWTQKTSANLGAAAYDSPVLEISEGDRTTRLVNRNEVAKNYLALKRDANEELLRLITAYKLMKSSPSQIIADDSSSDYPVIVRPPFRYEY